MEFFTSTCVPKVFYPSTALKVHFITLLSFLKGGNKGSWLERATILFYKFSTVHFLDEFEEFLTVTITSWRFQFFHQEMTAHLISGLHALSVYKKHLYKKQLVEFMKYKKRGLVRFQHAKKRLPNSKVVICRKNEKNCFKYQKETHESYA